MADDERRSHRVDKPRREFAEHEFPDSGEFVIYSKPTFYFRTEKGGELVEFDAKLRIKTGEATRTANGQREVPVEILSWDADGRSEFLQKRVGFRMAKAHPSSARAGSSVADFPARLTLNIDFVTLVDGKQIDESKGTASGWISAFPPSANDLFSITKGGRSHDLAQLSGGVLSGPLSIHAVACMCPTSVVGKEVVSR